MKLSIIIPVYNEEKTVVTVLEKLRAISLPGVSKEIIIVDDGSKDNTKSKITNFNKKYKLATIVIHKTNKGKGAAVQSGLQKATGEYILIQDADLEYNPIDIPLLLQPIKDQKVEVVYGTRLKRLPNFKRDERNFQFFVQYMGNKALSFITAILYGQMLTDMETGYKVFPKKALNGIRLSARSFDFEPEITVILMKSGYRIHEVAITTNPRGYKEGKKLRAFKDGSQALYTLLKYKFQ